MNDKYKPELIVTKQWAVGKIFVLLGLVLGVGVGTFAVQKAQDVRSRAVGIVASPSPFVLDIVASPDASLSAPYLRLVSDKNNYKPGEKVTISVYAHTDTQPIVETKLQIVFNENALEFRKDDVSLGKVFKSYEVDTASGFVFLDLFVNPQVGHEPVQTEHEEKIATLSFITKEIDKKETVIDIEFNKESTQSSQMISFKDAREENPENALNSVSGVAFDITP